jgi:large subunit ribosomal protein L24
MKKIRKGDLVSVLTGKDKGKTGTVLACLSDGYVSVQGINLVKKHTKPNPAKNQMGGIVSKEMPIHVSNVAIVNPQTQRPDFVKFKLLADGKKVRVFCSSGESV